MDARFLKGIEEFNRRFFFEAHDLWEEVWVETVGDHRLFYQGLIQTAVGFYHLSMPRSCVQDSARFSTNRRYP